MTGGRAGDAGPAPPVALVAAAAVASGVALGATTVLAALAIPIARTLGGLTASVLPAVALAVGLLAGVLTGPLTQRRGLRPVLVAAGVLVPAGLGVVAAGPPPVVAVLAAALGVGAGAGCALVPALTAVALGTGRLRPLALAITSAGGAIGSAISAPLAVWLTDRAGLPDGLRALAVGAAVLLLGCAVAARPGPGRAAPTPPRPAPAPSVAPPATPHRRSGRIHLASVALSTAVFVPVVHLPVYADAHGLGPVFGAAMISVVGVASVGGRLLAGGAATRIAPDRVLRAGAMGLVAGAVIWSAGPHPGVVAAAAGVLGLAHGGYVAAFPAAVADREGPHALGSRLGRLYTSSAAGALLGPLTAAALTATTRGPGAAVALAGLAALAGWWLLGPGHDDRERSAGLVAVRTSA